MKEPVITYFARFPKIIYLALKIFIVKEYTYRASALSFTTLLAIIPYIFVMIFFATFLPFFSNIIGPTKSYFLSHFVPTSAGILENYFEIFVQQASHLPIINILFLFITAVIMVNTIEEALNEIWKANKRKKIYLTTIIYFFLVLIIPFVIAVSAILSSFIVTIPIFVIHTFKFELAPLFLLFLPILTNSVIFTLIYILVPNTYVKFFDGLFGGITAAILLEFARLGFGLYLTFFPSYSLIYGAFAVIPIFLIWLYIFWSIFLYCGLLTSLHSKKLLSNPKYLK